MNLSDFTIGARLRSGFALVLGFSLVLAAAALLQLQRMGAVVNEINDSWTMSVIDLNEIRDVLADVRRSELRHVLVTTEPERDAEDRVREDIWKRLDTPTRRYEATGISSAEEQALYDDFKTTLAAYRAHWPRLRALARAGADQGASARAFALGESKTIFDATRRS